MLKRLGRKQYVILFIFYMLLTIALFWEQIAKNQLPMSGDGLLWLNIQAFFRKSVLEGEFPLWNKLLTAGRPYVADLTNQALYPINYLLIFFNTKWYIYLYYGFHLALGSVFFTLYLEIIGIEKYVSYLCGMTYFFSINLGGARKDHWPLIACSVFLPLLLYCIEKYCKTSDSRVLYLSSLALTAQLLIGFPQYAIYTDLLCGFYLVIRGIKSVPIKHLFKDTVLWVILYIGLSSVQLIPFAEQFLYYSGFGAEKISLETMKTYSIHPLVFLQMICPRVFGDNVWAPLSQGYGTSGFDIEVFISTVAFSFMIYAIVVNYKDYYVRLLAVFMVLSALYSMIGISDVLSKIVYHIPIISGMRVPSRALFIFIFFSMVLSAYGIQSYVSISKKTNILLGIMFLELCVVIGLVLLSYFGVLKGFPFSPDEGDYKRLLECYSKTIIILLFMMFFTLLTSKSVIHKPAVLIMTLVLILTDKYPYWKYTNYSDAYNLEANTAYEKYLVENAGNYKAIVSDPTLNYSGLDNPFAYNSNMPIKLSVINSYNNINDSRVSLLMTSRSILSPTFNYSGEYKGFVEIQKNFYQDCDVLNMLGVKYIADEFGTVPEEVCIDVITGNNLDTVYTNPKIEAVDYDGVYIFSDASQFEEGNAYRFEFSLNKRIEEYGDVYVVIGDQAVLVNQNNAISLDDGNCRFRYSCLVDSAIASTSLDHFALYAYNSPERFRAYDLCIDKMEMVTISNPYIHLFDDGNVKIYENTNAKDILYIPSQVRKLTDGDFIYGHNYDYLFDDISYVRNVESFTPSAGVIKNINFKTNVIEATVETEDKSFVVFSQASYPDWKAYVDGKEVEIKEVNGYIQGINIPEGEHRIRFAFIPVLFYIGAGISCIFLLILFSLINPKIKLLKYRLK